MPSLHLKNWQHAFEICLYVSKGQPKTFHFLSQAECVNVYRYCIPEKETSHPTEKPIAFIRRLIKVSSQEGNLVLDPFIGSGTTVVAAKQLLRKFIGFEKEPKYVKIAHKRLAQECLLKTHTLSDD